MMHLCAGDHDGGRRLFEQVLAIDPANNMGPVHDSDDRLARRS